MNGDPVKAEKSGDHKAVARVASGLRQTFGGAGAGEQFSARARATHQKLLAAAAAAFSQQGYEQTRVADIVERAGVAHGSFYRYFDDKDVILRELLVQLYAELNVATRTESGHELQATPQEMLAQLETFNIRFFHEYARRRELLRVAREAAASSSSPRFREMWLLMRGRFVARTRRLIERLQARGLAAGLEPRLCAEALGATSEQMAYVLVGLPERTPEADELDAIGRACNAVWAHTLFPEEARDDR